MCGETRHTQQGERCTAPIKCPNCNESHTSTYGKCTERILAAEKTLQQQEKRREKGHKTYASVAGSRSLPPPLASYTPMSPPIPVSKEAPDLSTPTVQAIIIDIVTNCVKNLFQEFLDALLKLPTSQQAPSYADLATHIGGFITNVGPTVTAQLQQIGAAGTVNPPSQLKSPNKPPK
jgi:hypothetical protein